MSEQNQKKQINIELSEEMAEGTYANMFMIGHSNSEFIIDFIKWMPGVAKAKVKLAILQAGQAQIELIEHDAQTIADQDVGNVARTVQFLDLATDSQV